KAVRDAELAADVSGVNIARTKILSFVISAVFAGVAGALYAHTFHYISPEFFGLGRTIILLAMVIVGGKGSVAGVIAGVALLTLLPEALRFVKQYYMVAFGLGVDRKSTRLNSSHVKISYAVFCLKKKIIQL